MEEIFELDNRIKDLQNELDSKLKNCKFIVHYAGYECLDYENSKTVYERHYNEEFDSYGFLWGNNLFEIVANITIFKSNFISTINGISLARNIDFSFIHENYELLSNHPERNKLEDLIATCEKVNIELVKTILGI